MAESSEKQKNQFGKNSKRKQDKYLKMVTFSLKTLNESLYISLTASIRVVEPLVSIRVC